MSHTGRGDYFDPRSQLADGQSHVERTVAVIGSVVDGITQRMSLSGNT
jgi:hypothetical protein